MEEKFSGILLQLSDAIAKAEDADLVEHKIIMGRLNNVKQHIAGLLDMVADLEKNLTDTDAEDHKIQSGMSALAQAMGKDTADIANQKAKNRRAKKKENDLFSKVLGAVK